MKCQVAPQPGEKSSVVTATVGRDGALSALSAGEIFSSPA